MVGKMMKHELVGLFRILIWFMGGILLLGILARVGFEAIVAADLEGSSIVGVVLSITLLLVLWYVSVIAMQYAAAIVSVVRYFKSLFTGEGYLTFSLPITPSKLLVAKFLSALIATVSCWVVVVLSVLIALPTEVWTQFVEQNVLSSLFETLGALFNSDPISILEFVLILIAMIPAGLLYLYLIASIGQLFTKARVAICFGLYFGVSFVLSLLFTSLVVPLALAVSGRLLIWIAIAVLYAFDVGSFLVIRHILLHKVNLVV